MVVGSSETGARDTGTLPLGKDRAEVAVGEAPTLRPDADVDDTDNEVRAEVRLSKEVGAVGGEEAKEARGAGGEGAANLLQEGGHNAEERGERSQQ